MNPTNFQAIAWGVAAWLGWTFGKRLWVKAILRWSWRSERPRHDLLLNADRSLNVDSSERVRHHQRATGLVSIGGLYLMIVVWLLLCLFSHIRVADERDINFASPIFVSIGFGFILPTLAVMSIANTRLTMGLLRPTATLFFSLLSLVLLTLTFAPRHWHSSYDCVALVATVSLATVLFTRCLIFLDQTFNQLTLGIAPYRQRSVKILDIMILTLLLGLLFPLFQQTKRPMAILAAGLAMTWIVGATYMILRRQIAGRTYRSFFILIAWWIIPMFGLGLMTYLNTDSFDLFIAAIATIGCAALAWCGVSIATGWLIHVGWKAYPEKLTSSFSSSASGQMPRTETAHARP